MTRIATRIRFRAAGFDARPHRPSSLRAHAQRKFVAAAEQDEVLRRHDAGNPVATLTPLTLKAKELYENSVVPVREIARLLGVHERTLYKYVQKYQWRRRYAVPGARPAAPRPRRKNSRFAAQPRGAGGRYISRERSLEPVAHGLKALDPNGAARALTACRHAKTISDEAMARTRRLRSAHSQARALVYLSQALRDLAAIEQADTRARNEAAAEAADLDTRRRELARKLENLSREQNLTREPSGSDAAPAAPAETPITGGRIRLLSD